MPKKRRNLAALRYLFAGSRATQARPTLLYGVTVPTTAAVLLRGQLEYMRLQGWQVHLITSDGRGVDIVREREGATVHTIPMSRDISPGADLRALRDWWRSVRLIQPDVANLSTPKAALLGGLVCWALRVPRRIYLVRGLRLEGEHGPRRLLLWLLERLTIALATDVLVVSASLRDALVSNKLAARHGLQVIGKGSSNGVQAQAIADRLDRCDRRAIRERHGIPSDAFVVCFVGRLTSDKGIADLVSALQDPRTADTFLITAGDTEDREMLDQLERLGSRWRSLGWLEDPTPALAAADILCLPTYREGFPNVVLEAAAAGLPVITTTATGARDSVVEGRTGYIVPIGDPEALAERIIHCAADREGCKELGLAARQRVIEDFQPEHIWRALNDLYRAR